MAYNTRKKSIKAVLDALDSEDEHYFSASDSEYQASSSSSESSEEEKEIYEHDNDSSSDSSLEVITKLLDKCMDGVYKTYIKERDKIYTIKYDDYFLNSSQKKTLISNNALDKLETPRLPQDQLHKLLSKQQSLMKHKKDLQLLEKTNRLHFNKWLYLMHEGFNILLYGLGSKIEILKEFQKTYLDDVPVIVVNGFFPSLTIKSVIDSIVIDILELSENPANAYDACDLIAQELSYLPTLHLYMIIHNIEGDMLKNGKSQNVLSKLAAIKNFHIIASIDHVSAPLIWDNSKLSKLNFIWYDATSFLPYINETSFEGSMIVERSRTLALSSLNNVFLSLTSNSKGIYLIIVKYQLEHGGSQHYQGLLFKDLYWTCREAFLVSSDVALRSQLTEFVDHKMLKFRRSVDGSEYLIIPTATNILQQFFDEHPK